MKELKMKSLKVGIYFEDENGNIVQKRILGSKWSIADEQTFMNHHEKYFSDEVADILTENIKLELKPEVIKEMMKELRERE